jgi:hypothetical protein
VFFYQFIAHRAGGIFLHDQMMSVREIEGTFLFALKYYRNHGFMEPIPNYDIEELSTDRHAFRELAPIHGINLGFQNCIGFLLVGNSRREASTMLPKNPADCWNWPISS